MVGNMTAPQGRQEKHKMKIKTCYCPMSKTQRSSFVFAFIINTKKMPRKKAYSNEFT
jgi:hypothetical protein